MPPTGSVTVFRQIDMRPRQISRCVKIALTAWLGLSLVSTAGTAKAQIFTCKDSTGRTLTSDRPIAAYAARPMRELNKNGVVMREIPAPLTAEQKHQQQLEADRQRAQAEAVLEVRRRDQALLERFRNEDEIEAARKRAVADNQEKIRLELARVPALEKQLKDATAEAQRQVDKRIAANVSRQKSTRRRSRSMQS